MFSTLINDYALVALGVAVICVTARSILRRLFGPRQLPLPPGPKGYPVIGNLLDMPKTKEWLTFAEWKQTWGDLMSVKVLGQPIVIIQSSKVAIDMLDKRSATYSDRPVLTMGSQLVGWNKTLALTPYGARFREYRKLLFRTIGTRGNVKKYHALEEEETRRFLTRVLARPQNFAAEIRKTAGAIILMISHGYKVREQDDPIVDLVDRATEQFSLSTEPGAFLVDVIPQLQYIPEWFPGAGFKKTAKIWAKCLADMADIPHEFVKGQMAAGTAVPSFTSELLGTSSSLTLENEFNIKWSAASLYSGGADTTVSAIKSFFLAMTLYPEVQKKAQAEIDTVIGADRLPSFEDRERLLYIEALVKEVFRWNPVTPTGIAHRVTENDVYEGFFIPQGTLVIANIWQFLHDPEVYSNPHEFNPDRFMGPNPERDPRDLCFGFGRRICPGLNLADASVFISSAMSLAVFDISKTTDPKGQVIEPRVEYTDGTISHPKPFQCTIEPRSSRAAALISADV